LFSDDGALTGEASACESGSSWNSMSVSEKSEASDVCDADRTCPSPALFRRRRFIVVIPTNVDGHAADSERA